jgi:hypothetical protein
MVIRLGITGKLIHTLQSTNACESMISTVGVIDRSVEYWSTGEMCLRWTASSTTPRSSPDDDDCGRGRSD